MRDINIDDHLRRESVMLDEDNIRGLIEGRTVMVTGAGGSIGSEICRQVVKYAPETLILLGKDKDRMQQVFQLHKPDMVFHAAAHKHVPLMEVNVGQAVKNNVLGTKLVADLAHEFGADGFVLVSTDKAVHPTSVMGATKHIAERYVHALSQESSTRFIVTRFGNVLGSHGSVVPLFQKQIRNGGPITITDPEMTRYFMSIPEASRLVLQAAAMGRGGEIFVLDMGSPVKIVDLAHDLIRLAGLPRGAIDIVFTGIRPGEKLYEELYFEEEETLPTDHPRLRSAYHRPYDIAKVEETIHRFEESLYGPEEVVRQLLKQAIPEYQMPHTEETTVPQSA
jgi:FlaA1/EpsC-like NDP-sugar epimerase